MNRLVAALLILIVMAGCTVTKTNLRLDELDLPAIPADEVIDDEAAIRARAEGLWSTLETAKLATSITKERIAPYFESAEDRSNFIAIYASLFREKRFAREFVADFKIGRILIEENGVIAKVEVTIWGKIYAIWRHRIHEVETWKKTDIGWVLVPESY